MILLYAVLAKHRAPYPLSALVLSQKRDRTSHPLYNPGYLSREHPSVGESVQSLELPRPLPC
jgi:hypothetical protein